MWKIHKQILTNFVLKIIFTRISVIFCIIMILPILQNASFYIIPLFVFLSIGPKRKNISEWQVHCSIDGIVYPLAKCFEAYSLDSVFACLFVCSINLYI